MVNRGQRHCHVSICDSQNHRHRRSQDFRRPEVAHDHSAWDPSLHRSEALGTYQWIPVTLDIGGPIDISDRGMEHLLLTLRLFLLFLVFRFRDLVFVF